MLDNSPETIERILTRGVTEVIGGDMLRERLARGDVLRVKLGVDPTSPNLHIGRAVTLLKLRDFQEAGHTIVFIVGDFTGVIGDTSDKESERPMLTPEVISENKKNYFEQVGMLLDLDKVEMCENSSWLGELTYREIGEHADQFSVADFIARDNIKRRLDAGKRVSLREVLYPLMQGYDSVAVHASVEVGGTDQRFNLLAGRTLQTHAGQTPQVLLMNPLVMGLDGRKMSSSWGNTINLTDTPEDMYGKVMSVRDELVPDYFDFCTRVAEDVVRAYRATFMSGSVHPKEAKMHLAREIVGLYHGHKAAQAAERSFEQVFARGALPDDMPELRAVAGKLIVDVLLEAGVLTSRSEWRRLVAGGGVHLLGDQEEVVSNVDMVVTTELVLRLGKRRFYRIVVD